MRGQVDRVAWLAGRQHGRVARSQLLAAGLDADRIDRWVADGRLRIVHRGVYAVGHTSPSLHGDCMAAVLACGPGAVVSHHMAAHLLGLLRRAPPRPDVTVPSTSVRRRPGLTLHRVPSIDPLDVAVFMRIPITTVPRTLLDIAPSTQPEALARACHEAWIKHRTRPEHVEACIARNPRKPGIRKLRAALGSDVVLSDLERGFLKLLRRHRLPLPRTNVDHRGDKVDCHWPALNLTVELLSFRYHATRHGFEADVARRRRSDHVAYTWGDVFERGGATIADLRPRLGD